MGLIDGASIAQCLAPPGQGPLGAVRVETLRLLLFEAGPLPLIQIPFDKTHFDETHFDKTHFDKTLGACCSDARFTRATTASRAPSSGTHARLTLDSRLGEPSPGAALL